MGSIPCYRNKQKLTKANVIAPDSASEQILYSKFKAKLSKSQGHLSKKNSPTKNPNRSFFLENTNFKFEISTEKDFRDTYIFCKSFMVYFKYYL